MSPRDRILARRAKFVAAAFVGITGCSDELSATRKAEPCLTVAIDSGADTRDAADTSDTEPMVCLTADPDTGVDATDAMDATDATDATDTGPMPCLTPLPDGGV